MMNYQSLSGSSDDVRVEVSRFRGHTGVEEVHLVLQPRSVRDFDLDLSQMAAAYRNALARLGLDSTSAVFRRVFLSDAANCAAAVKASLIGEQTNGTAGVALSIVEQLPLPQRRLALWAYHVHDPAGLAKKVVPDGVVLDRGSNRHLWLGGLCVAADKESAYDQATAVLGSYAGRLRAMGATLADHAVRTWFFVNNVDLNYGGLVRGRTEVFAREGLTADSHYITSTGIEGRGAEPTCLVQLDAYAVLGLEPAQIRFLQAPEHLGPTHLYGVTFERGTAVDYRDRRHALISGTASIDPEGRSLHRGNALMQARRACQNVDALLADADCSPRDVAHMIVYFRDAADYARLWPFFADRYAGTPCLFVRAPVCRPEWLIEVECLAIRNAENPALPPF